MLCLLEPCSHIVSFATTGIIPDTSSTARCTHSFAPGDVTNTQTVHTCIVTMITSHHMRSLVLETCLGVSHLTNYYLHTAHKGDTFFSLNFFPRLHYAGSPERTRGKRVRDGF